MDENVDPAPEWLENHLMFLKRMPAPSAEEVIQQVDAAIDFRAEAERLATPTRDRARAVLLAAHLSQAIHTIEFLHGCLTSNGYKYAYPQQTLDRLREFEWALELVDLLPKTSGCPHSMIRDDCDSCRAGLEYRRRIEQAKAVLNGSYDVEDTSAQADQTAAGTSSGD